MRILIVTSTLPVDDGDPVPAFVKDQAIWLKKLHPELDIHILAPHNAYSETKKLTEHASYTEYRFHYFWPKKFEKLTGRAILPALRINPLLYFEIPFLLIAEFWSTLRLSKKLGVDLVYAHWFTPQAIAAFLASKFSRVPFVFTTHASDVIILKKLPFAKELVSAVCKRASAYTAVSQQTTDKLLYFATAKNSKLMKDKLVILPMGTEVTPISPNSVTKAKEKYGLTSKKVVLFIGRIVERKGVDNLLRAFKTVSESQPDTSLVIAGDGQEKSNMEQLCRELDFKTGQVVFTGYVTGEEKSGLIGAADILTIPSTKEGDQSEGLPVVFMEGIAAGRIVVASNVSGAQEYIKNGENGFVFEQKNEAQLASTILAGLNMKGTGRRKLEEKAKQTAKAFDWRRVADKHYKLFESLPAEIQQ